MRPLDAPGLAAHQPQAEGPHTVYKRGPDGRVTSYETFVRRDDPRDPKPWQSGKRVDLIDKAHYNKVTGQVVPTPHAQGRDIVGGVRPTRPDELPRGWS